MQLLLALRVAGLDPTTHVQSVCVCVCWHEQTNKHLVFGWHMDRLAVPTQPPEAPVPKGATADSVPAAAAAAACSLARTGRQSADCEGVNPTQGHVVVICATGVKKSQKRRAGQNRIFRPSMTVYLGNSLLKLPYIHRIYAWFWPTLQNTRLKWCAAFSWPCFQPTKSTKTVIT